MISTEAIAQNTNLDVTTHYNTGTAFQQQGKIEAAIDSYQQAISCWKKSSEKALLPCAVKAYSNWGCILAQEGKFDEAIAVFQAGIAVAPDDAALYNNLGIVLLELRKPEQAIALYRRAIELQPELVMAHYNLGKAFQQLGLHTFAGECFDRVISQNPDRVAVYGDRAVSLIAQGKLASAMLSFQNAIALESEFVEGFCRHVEMRLTSVAELNELDRSQIACVRFLRQLQGKNGSGSGISDLTKNPLAPSSLLLNLADTYFHLGNTLAEYGGYEQAEQYYQKALQIQPKNADIYLRLADCLSQQQRFSAAIVIYRLVLAIAGDRSDICDRLQAVLEQQKLQQLTRLYPSLDPPKSPLKRGTLKVLPVPPLRRGARGDRADIRGARGDRDIKVDRGDNSPAKIPATPQSFGHPRLTILGDIENSKFDRSLPSIVNGNEQQKSKCHGLDCQRCLRRIFRQFEPVHLGDGVYSCDRQHKTAFESPQTFVTSLPNGRAWIVPQKNSWMICNAIAIIDEQDRLLPELSREYPGELPGCDNQHSTPHRFLNLKPEELPPLEKIDGTVAVLAGLSGNVYFHWMVDILPRMEILHRWGVNVAEIDWFLVNSCQQPFQRETLKALGIPEYKIIESDRHPYIQAKQLIVPSFSGYLGWLSTQGLEFLRRVFSREQSPKLPESFASESKNPHPERIYISRSKCSYRRVINEEKVIDFLSGFGFVPVLLESMTLNEQIALFARAKVIIAPHGSGLTNIIFCSPGTKVIELTSPNYIRHYYWAIGQQLNLEHYYVTGENFECYPIRQLMYQNPLTEDILVNLNYLKNMMGNINLIPSKNAQNLMASEEHKKPRVIMNQESADYFQKRAELYLEQGKLADAVAACEQALKHQPDFAPAYKTLGNISEVQGNLAKAKHWYTKALELQPNFAEVYTKLATLYAQEKNWDMALVCYQQSTSTPLKNTVSNHNNIPGVLAFNPEDIEVYIQGAESFYAQRKFEQAATACQRVIQVKPDARVYKIWGNARQAQGKVEEAKNCYAKAIELEPDFAEAYTNLGTLYAQEQQWQSAIAFYQKAIALQPNLASTYRNLARVWAQMGQLSEADGCWFKAYSLEPAKATPEEHIQLGDNFLRQNQVTQAIRCYCHAIELNPNFNQAYQQLGNALKAQRKLQEEVANYRKNSENQANLSGDLLNTVVVGANPKAELHQNPQTSTLQANVAANSLQLNSTIAADQPRVQLQQQQQTIPAVPQLLNTIAHPANSAPAVPNSADVSPQVTVVDSGFTTDFRRQDTADNCIQRAESYCAQKQFDSAIAECQRAIEIQPDAVAAYKLWGSILQGRGNLAGAIECYQTSVKINSNDVQAYVNLGSLYAMKQQRTPAIACYQKAIALQPNLAAAYRNLARVWMQDGKQEEANECWYEAFSLEPEKVSPNHHFKLGNILFRQDKITQAIACYQRAIELNPNLNAAYQNLAKALTKQGKLDEAAVCLQKVAVLNGNCSVSGSKAVDTVAAATQVNASQNSGQPAAAVATGDALASSTEVNNPGNNPAKSAATLRLSAKAIDSGKPLTVVNSVSTEAYIKQAESYYAQGKFEEAITECKRAIEMKPEEAIAYKILGNATQAMGKVDAARYWYAKALEIDPNFAEIHANLGSIYARHKQWQKSINSYQKALDLKPDLGSAYRNLANVFLQSGHPQVAAEYWYEALSLDINWATGEEHFTLGNTLLELGQLEKAISCYRRAIQLQPSYADAYHNLGEVLSVQEQWEDAIAAYWQAIELKPNYEGSHYSLGKVWATLDRREDAIACYRRAIELNPSFAQAYQSLGEVLDRHGQLDEAIGCYEKTIELKPDIWEFHHKLGDALQEKGEIDGAIHAYHRAIELAKN
ncbi:MULTISPECIES: tetratricopeptide repeat protein [unclassified Microcoleus]|uniref:tetratricopeptide repeat protein n=1 Tax=unclassified Microcoleus TaxID=2642155 RepID=UPI002FD28B0E